MAHGGEMVMMGTSGGDRSRSVVASRRAFTLVELIVAAAVIAVSAALLFPVFACGREGGRQLACPSNLR